MVDIFEYEADEEILLHFDIGGDGLDTQTFGNALISFDALYRAINDVANPGREIEVEFIRSDQGSIRAIFRVVSKDVRSLIRAPISLILMPILLGVLVNKVTSDSINIIIKDDLYVVEHGSEKVVLPRSSAELAKKADGDPAVRRQVRSFFSVVEFNPTISAIDFRSPSKPNSPVLPIERKDFATLRDLPDIVPLEAPRTREETYKRIPVVVITAVLARSTCKWQFLWQGHKISADIRDDIFFLKLANHEYEFGQGDTLVVDLVAQQELNTVAGAYENKSYYISRVHRHSKGSKQESML